MNKLTFFTIFSIFLLIFSNSCKLNVTQDKIFSMNQVEFLDTDEVQIKWIVTDDRSLSMNYSLYNDDLIIAQGDMLNNTLVELNLTLDPSKESRTLWLYVEDENKNLGSAFVTVNLSDRTAPIVVLFEVVAR